MRYTVSFFTALCFFIGAYNAIAQTSTTSIGYYYYEFWLTDGTKKYFVSDVMEYEKVSAKHYMETLRIRYPEIIPAKSSGSFNAVIPNITSRQDWWQKAVAQRLQSIESAKKGGYQIIEIGMLKPTIKPHTPSTVKPN